MRHGELPSVAGGGAEGCRSHGFPPLLLLGTAQLGLPYGIVRTASPAESDAAALAVLKEAAAAGFGGVDTALAYGAAPRRVGDFFGKNPELGAWVVCTKLMAGDGGADLAGLWARHMGDLGRTSVFALLLHRSHEAENPEVCRFCAALKREGQVRHLGVSVYGVEEWAPAASRGFGGAVELPLNALSVAHWEGEGDALKKAFVIARSVFLQGVLLRDPSALPDEVRHLAPAVRTFQHLCALHGLSPLEGALSAVLGVPWISALTVGADAAQQVREVGAAWGAARVFLASDPRSGAFLDRTREISQSIEPSAIDPRRWKT